MHLLKSLQDSVSNIRSPNQLKHSLLFCKLSEPEHKGKFPLHSLSFRFHILKERYKCTKAKHCHAHINPTSTGTAVMCQGGLPECVPARKPGHCLDLQCHCCQLWMEQNYHGYIDSFSWKYI